MRWERKGISRKRKESHFDLLKSNRLSIREREREIICGNEREENEIDLKISFRIRLPFSLSLHSQSQ